ncbi:hypothetical protein B0H12DRAFT_1092183 [Mycena haematopus]|nr:hypothetical protein B0H12DRAFT_1092183 [Mycena haematopus]
MTTVTATVVLRSLPKPDRLIVVPTPVTARGVYDVAAEHDGDLSWDVCEVVEVEGAIIAERPRREERLEGRKILAGGLLRELDELKKIVLDERLKTRELQKIVSNEQKRADAVHVSLVQACTRLVEQRKLSLRKMEAEADAQDVIDRHEAVALCLQGIVLSMWAKQENYIAYNDIIFDTLRQPIDGGYVMDEPTKALLKANDLGYITHLLKPPRHNFKGEVIGPDVHASRLSALGILSEAERGLCHRLRELFFEGRSTRNTLQHPKPDRRTTLEYLAKELETHHMNTLRLFLAKNPKRLRGKHEKGPVPLHLFVEDGEHESANDKRLGITALKEDIYAQVEELQQIKAAQDELLVQREG